MKILIATPTLGDSAWLAGAVASMAALSPPCQHVLICPNSAVKALIVRFPGTTVVAEPGGGMYAAINAALAAVEAWDAFTYINDDDLLLPGFSKVVAAMADPTGRPSFVYGRVRLIDGAGHRLGAVPVSHWPDFNRELYAQRLEPVYQHGTLVSRAAWKQCGGFDPSFRFCGDSEFLARLCLGGVPAVYVGDEVAAFRLRPGQLTKNRSAMVEERKRVDLKLGLLKPRSALSRHWARLVFRSTNLPAYAERIARYGFISFDELLERGT